MSKWVGNRFGNNPVGVTTFFVSAVHKMYDQYYAKQSGGWKPEPLTASGGVTFTATHGSTPYKYHVFTASSDTFTVLTGAGQVEVLIVAGGGGGGAGRDGGGGGAGGFRVVTSSTLTPGPYPIVIGAGGAAMPYWAGYSRGYPHPSAARGGSSTAFGFTSTGGGGRPAPSGPPGTAPGGSGCGAAIEASGQGAGNTPPVSPPQGNPGGAGGYVYPGPEPGFLCGGGGGAGATGGSSSPTFGAGNGGIGSRSDGITPLAWTIPASYGTPGPSPGRYFAGGGGGGAGTWQGTPGGGIGGSGGGGPKGTGGTSGTTNTGGGGGGGHFSLNNNYSGGNGGSGIIFVRYAQ